MYFVGVDGGGSKTTAVFADAGGQTIRTMVAGPGNIAVLDRDATTSLLRSIKSTLLKREKIEHVKFATFAFAGAGKPPVNDITRELIASLGFRQFALMSDAELLYYSIFGEQCGILLHAGTGSFCLCKGSDGNLRQLGGIGYLLGDEGSGFDIGNRAIRAAMKDYETDKRPTRLTEALLSFYGIRRPEEFISIIYASANPPRLIASCAKRVSELAGQGDPNALNILNRAAESLENLLSEAIRLCGEQSEYHIALTGGVLQASSVMFKNIQRLPEKLGIRCMFVQPEFPPAVAALLHSFNKCGLSVSNEFKKKLQNITFSVAS